MYTSTKARKIWLWPKGLSPQARKVGGPQSGHMEGACVCACACVCKGVRGGTVKSGWSGWRS